MNITSEQTKIRLKKFLSLWKQNQEDLALEELSALLNEIHREKEHYVEKSEIKELIIEIREGFRRMEERFIASDKRFEDIHKRFNFLQWFLGISMSIFFSIITIFFGYIAYTSQKQTDLIIQQLQNLQKVIVEQKVK